MSIFDFEHSQTACRVDLAFYALLCAGLVVFLVWAAPRGLEFELAALALAGLLAWTLIEYGLHRFVLHGLAPFSRWHEEHHRRPLAHIYSPTIVSAGLILLLVFLPMWPLTGAWQAAALSLGVLIGYSAYSVMHHALHHWHSERPWFVRLRRSHAQHHYFSTRGDSLGVQFGVTTNGWDQVFGTDQAPPRRPR